MVKRKSCKEYRNTEWSFELDPEDWEIVNTSKDGGSNHYGVKLWSGAGYMLTPYSVWADSMEEALTLVGEWCEKHAPGMIITADRVFEEIEDGMVEIIKKDPEKYGFTEDEVESESNKKLISSLQKRDKDLYWNLREQSEQENYIDEWAYPTENPDIYLWAENLWIDKWPKDYPSLEDEEDEEVEENKKLENHKMEGADSFLKDFKKYKKMYDNDWDFARFGIDSADDLYAIAEHLESMMDEADSLSLDDKENMIDTLQEMKKDAIGLAKMIEDDEARNMEDESKTYRKEASVVGPADDHIAWNIALVAQHNNPYAKQIWNLINSLIKKDARGQKIEADKLLKSSFLDSLVRDIIREIQRDDEEGDYRYISTATKKLAKEYITDAIMSRFDNEKNFVRNNP